MGEKNVCSGDCMYQWGCYHCNTTYCDCTQCPSIFEGKDYLTDPERSDFKVPEEFICEKCAYKYLDRNVGKGRHKKKLFRKTSRLPYELMF
jgi:hypothetical protein